MEPTTADSQGVAESSSAVLPMPESDAYGYVAPLWHTLLVLTVQGFLCYRGRMRLAQLQTLADAHRVALYERTILFEWLMLGLVLAGVWWHGSSLLTVLGRRWSSLRHFLGDLAIGVMFLMVAIAMGAMLPHGDGNVAKLILPQGRTEMWLWVAISFTAGICEEAIYRGYLQRQFISVTRSVPAGIILSAAVFGAAHGYQGLSQALQIGVLGAIAGTIAFWRKSVRPGMMEHVLQDLLGGFVRH